MMSRRMCGPIAACAAWIAVVMASPGPVAAQGIDYVRAHYTKYEYRIPMRDGVRLFTAVYVPKEQGHRYPMMLSRTPYGIQPYGEDAYKGDIGPSPAFGREGYIVAYQDVRGRWMSEGEFENMRPHRDRKEKPTDIDESTDTYDTIDWLINHVPDHNGRVGMWGISYPGFYTAAGMIDAHPALKAASPQAPVTDWFAGDDWHHNGAFFLPHAFNFMASFGRPRPEPTQRVSERFRYGTPDGYAFFLRMGPLSNANRLYFKDDVAFWNEIMRHSSYDEFWQARDIRRHLKGIKPAVMTVGGWYDAENLFGALETYKKVEASSPGATNVLVMGPWRHGGWSRGDGASLGPVPFHSKTGEFFRDRIEFPFFQHHLKGKATPDFPEAWVFETGTNQWRTFDAWPPRKARPRSLFLRSAWQPRLRSPAAAVGRCRRGIRRVRQRSRPSGRVHRADRRGHGRRLHDPGSAGRVAPARRAGVHQRRAEGGHDDRRPDRGAAVRVDQRHRLRLDREADRRLSRRLSRRWFRFAGEVRRIPAARPWGRPAREVPQQPVEAGAVRPERAHARELRAPGRLAHVPGPSQDHDPDPEQLVPAGRPQSADVCGYLSGPGVRLPAGDPARVPQSSDAFPTGTARAPEMIGLSRLRPAGSDAIAARALDVGPSRFFNGAMPKWRNWQTR